MRARLGVASATLGIAATLLAYAVSPGVRHAVGHAEHSVKHAVTRVFDHDTRAAAKHPLRPAPVRHPAPVVRPRAPAAGRTSSPGG